MSRGCHLGRFGWVRRLRPGLVMDRLINCYEHGQHWIVFGQTSAWVDWLMMMIATNIQKMVSESGSVGKGGP